MGNPKFSFFSFFCKRLLKFWWIGPLSEVWQLSLASSEIGVVGETWDALTFCCSAPVAGSPIGQLDDDSIPTVEATVLSLGIDVIVCGLAQVN